MAKGIHKHLRKEKAKIRREIFDLTKQENLIQQLYEKFRRDKEGEKTNNKK